jgi:hypothetical protein
MAVLRAAQHEMARSVCKRLAREINLARNFHSISRKGKESFDVHGGI